MKKHTKAESMKIMVESKTEKAISAIAGISSAVAMKNGPFDEKWICQICSVLRKRVDELEEDLLIQSRRKQPFRLTVNAGKEEVV